MKYQILAVDDQPDNLLVLEDCLEEEYDVKVFNRGNALLDYFEKGGKADLILLDIVMPMPDGYALCRWLKAGSMTRDIPVVFLTSLDSTTDESYALSLGAEDFIHKPLSPPILLARVRNYLLLSQTRRALLSQSRGLEKMIAEGTRKIQEQSDELVRRTEQIIASQGVIISAFCSLAETRDNNTGNHIRRTQHFLLALCEKLKEHPRFAGELTPQNIQEIFRSAPLHDVGKIAIPDQILLKPGKLTPEEWEIMKQHSELGVRLIDMVQKEIGANSPGFLKYAHQITLAHHEHWNGDGYPLGLSGDRIPLAARLMAVVDVYDALTSRRVYKEAIAHWEAINIMSDGRGKHFDPDIIDGMLAIAPQFADIACNMADAEK